MRRNILFTAAGAATLVGLAAGPAQADEAQIAAASNALKSDNFYLDSGANIDKEAELSSTFAKVENISLVVLSKKSNAPMAPKLIADEIQKNVSSYETIIVVQGDSFDLATFGNYNKMVTAINESIATGATPAEAILQNMEVLTSSSTVAEVGTSPQGEASDGIGSAAVIGGTVLGLLALSIAIGYFASKFRKKKPGLMSEAVLDTVPEDLKRSVLELERLSREYKNRSDYMMVKNIQAVLNHANELFTRLKKKGSTASFNSAAVQYADTFQKLSVALGPDYYMDITDKPKLWIDPVKRIKEVREAVKNTDAKLVQNIRQVNSNKDLDMKVALHDLTKSLDDAPSIQNIFGTDS